MALNDSIITNISSFDNLSNEILLCIFDYLTPIERYKAFFNYNSRLRLLVKQWTEYSRKKLTADILRFSTLHSWYKHLYFHDGGTIFYMLPIQGEQQRNILHKKIKDYEQLHWYFFCNINYITNEHIRTIIARYPIYLNPFFYHSERRFNKNGYRIFYGGMIIMENYQDEIVQWLYENYPEYIKNILHTYNTWETLEYYLVPIFDNEWKKALITIHNAAYHIWNDLKNLNDINVFDI